MLKVLKIKMEHSSENMIIKRKFSFVLFVFCFLNAEQIPLEKNCNALRILSDNISRLHWDRERLSSDASFSGSTVTDTNV